MASQLDLTRFYDVIIRISVFELGFLTREFQIIILIIIWSFFQKLMLRYTPIQRLTISQNDSLDIFVDTSLSMFSKMNYPEPAMNITLTEQTTITNKML